MKAAIEGINAVSEAVDGKDMHPPSLVPQTLYHIKVIYTHCKIYFAGNEKNDVSAKKGKKKKSKAQAEGEAMDVDKLATGEDERQSEKKKKKHKREEPQDEEMATEPLSDDIKQDETPKKKKKKNRDTSVMVGSTYRRRRARDIRRDAERVEGVLRAREDAQGATTPSGSDGK